MGHSSPRLLRPDGASRVRAGDAEASPRPRLLLVEDETLVAMMMKDMLAELEFEVLGPFGSIGDASAALLLNGIPAIDGIAAAVLDINVGGEPIYPLAARIAERGVPLVFVTGYTPESIDERFAAVPVLQKPIEGTVLKSVFVRSPAISDVAIDGPARRMVG